MKGLLEGAFPEDVLFGHWAETCPNLPHLNRGRSFFGTSGLGQSEMWCPVSPQLRQRDSNLEDDGDVFGDCLEEGPNFFLNNARI